MTKNLNHNLQQPQTSPQTRGQLLTFPTARTGNAESAMTSGQPYSDKPATSNKQGNRYLIDGLSMLDERLGKPVWFWPAVMGLLFGVMPLLASYLENKP